MNHPLDAFFACSGLAKASMVTTLDAAPAES